MVGVLLRTDSCVKFPGHGVRGFESGRDWSFRAGVVGVGGFVFDDSVIIRSVSVTTND